MSKPDIRNASPIDVQVVLFVHRKTPLLVKQSYDKIIVVNSADGTAPEFFQAGLNQYNIDGIYGFLSEYDYLACETSIEKIIEAIGNPYFGAVYCDGYIKNYGLIPQIFPSFCKDTLKSAVINTPLFVGSGVVDEWDTKLETAYFFDYFKKLGRKTMLCQVPEPLIVTEYHTTSQDEINQVNQKYG